MELEKEVIALKIKMVENNLVIKGIAEDVDESEEMTKRKVQCFIKDELQINGEVSIEKAWRQDKRSTSANSRLIVMV